MVSCAHLAVVGAVPVNTVDAVVVSAVPTRPVRRLVRCAVNPNDRTSFIKEQHNTVTSNRTLPRHLLASLILFVFPETDKLHLMASFLEAHSNTLCLSVSLSLFCEKNNTGNQQLVLFVCFDLDGYQCRSNATQQRLRSAMLLPLLVSMQSRQRLLSWSSSSWSMLLSWCVCCGSETQSKTPSQKETRRSNTSIGGKGEPTGWSDRPKGGQTVR